MSQEIDPDWPAPAYDPSAELDTTPPARDRWPRRVAWSVAVLVTVVCLVAGGLMAFTFLHREESAAAPSRPSGAPSPAASPAPTGPTASCGPDQAAAVAAALSQLPKDPKTGRPWNPTPEQSNYDACAELSTVLVTIVDARKTSPDQALMFHQGKFVGTATPTAYAFTSLVEAASTDQIVVLTYRTGQTCGSCEDGTLTIVGYQWDGDHVQRLDPLPAVLESPP